MERLALGGGGGQPDQRALERAAARGQGWGAGVLCLGELVAASVLPGDLRHGPIPQVSNLPREGDSDPTTRLWGARDSPMGPQ